MSQNVLLGDICDVKIGRTPPRKESEWFSSVDGEKWISIKDMGSSGKYLTKTSEYLTKKAVEKFRVPMIPAGTLMMSFKLTVGRLNFAGDDMYSNEAIAQLPIKDVGLVDNEWLYYYLSNFNFDSLSSTSSIATAVNSQSVKKIPVYLPNIAEQKKIADILGTLDEKIELNREMNETLEQMGHALFKHYFITNPVAKEWEEKSLDEVAEFLNGLAMQKYPIVAGEPTLPVIKIREMSSGITPNTDIASAGIPEKYVVRSGDLLFSWSGTLLVKFWSENTGALNQHLFKVTSSEYPEWFYYHWTSHHLDDFKQTAKSKATTMGHIQRRHLTQAKVLVPDVTDMQKIGEQIQPLIDRSKANSEQIQTLTTLRDTLLPRLISGKVKI